MDGRKWFGLLKLRKTKTIIKNDLFFSHQDNNPLYVEASTNYNNPAFQQGGHKWRN